jgi:hypothetical protein
MICERMNLWDDQVGTPCPDCGHTALLHPGPGERSPDVCQVCRTMDQADRMDVLLVATQRYRDELRDLVSEYGLTRSITMGYWEERMSDGSTVRHPMPKATSRPWPVVP